MKKLIFIAAKCAALWGGAFVLSAASVLSVTSLQASSLREPLPPAFATAAVIFVGEVHDNPEHHLRQVDVLRITRPKAVVWEMITQTQAEGLAGLDLTEAELVAQQLQWDSSGWPEFALYAPVFAAAQEALQFGALVPRSVAAAALDQGVAAYFGPQAALLGLDIPLSEAQQASREADQLANHCNAMPVEMLPILVAFQRLRDAALAAAVLQALAATGGPVVVITGNGHARADHGAPVYLAGARPGLRVVTLGQAEAGQIRGDFDLVLDADPISRPDPCLAFQQD